MVSNGCEIVATDAEGRWALPVASGDSIFVIKPPHWSTGRPQGIPRFSYLHQPAGTPISQALASPAVSPTGPLPRSIDFPLYRRPEPARFDALLFADTQAATASELEFVRRDLLQTARGSQAAFAINHGDVMGDDLTLLEPYLAILKETGLEWHHCPGNHDLNLDASGPAFGFESWKQIIGPTHYAFQYAGALFILLNNVEYLGQDAIDRDGRRYRGRIGARQLQFVDNLLQRVPEETLVVVSMHIPLVSFDDPDSPCDTTEDRRDLLKLLSRRRHTMSFAGHSHTTEHHDLGREQGFDRNEPHRHCVLTAASGSWWSGPLDARGVPRADSRDGTPRGFHVLSVDGNRATTRFESLNAETPQQLRVMLRTRDAQDRVHVGAVSRGALSNVELLANAFDGGPATRVTYEISGAPSAAVEMTKIAATDPYIVESYERHRALLKPWVAAAPSSHIWSAPLPSGLACGVHEVVVRTTGENGSQHSARFAVDVVNA